MGALRSVSAWHSCLSLLNSCCRAGSLYPLPPQYAGAYGSLGMEQLAAWHQVTLVMTWWHDDMMIWWYDDMMTTEPLCPQASMYQHHRAASPYSGLTPPPGLPRYSPGAGPGLPPHHPGLGFPQLSHHHLPHVKHDFDRPPGLLHPDDKVSRGFFKFSFTLFL